VVVSTHLDDAVLSLGGLMWTRRREGARQVVVTVFAGEPPTPSPPSTWDRSCGFRDGAAAAAARRREDVAALGLLGVEHLHLPHPDRPYRTGLDAALVGGQLLDVTDDDTDVYVPAAIGAHPDHVLVRDAVMGAMAGAGERRMWAYADLPYASLADGWMATPPRPPALPFPSAGVPVPLQLDTESWQQKVRAVLCYASQLSTLGVQFGAFLAPGGPLQREMICPVPPGAAR
jgi:LmbE family N-acetylglucosaminyl deacetylase